MRRTVVAHLGPTNSGKTHAALQALRAAPRGVYCGPLRLLAAEVAERLSEQGVAVRLVTGQEVRDAPGATHVACTVEMASVSERVEVRAVTRVLRSAPRDSACCNAQPVLQSRSGTLARGISCCIY
eukprot:363400-Chlamydomonas_euryale.AAC.4